MSVGGESSASLQSLPWQCPALLLAHGLLRRVPAALAIENEPDCCTVFHPEHPVIHGRLEECLAAEAQLDVDGLVTRSFEARRELEIA